MLEYFAEEANESICLDNRQQIQIKRQPRRLLFICIKILCLRIWYVQRELTSCLLLHFHVSCEKKISVKVEYLGETLQNVPDLDDCIVNVHEYLIGIFELIWGVLIYRMILPRQRHSFNS